VTPPRVRPILPDATSGGRSDAFEADRTEAPHDNGVAASMFELGGFLVGGGAPEPPSLRVTDRRFTSPFIVPSPRRFSPTSWRTNAKARACRRHVLVRETRPPGAWSRAASSAPGGDRPPGRRTIRSVIGRSCGVEPRTPSHTTRPELLRSLGCPVVEKHARSNPFQGIELLPGWLVLALSSVRRSVDGSGFFCPLVTGGGVDGKGMPAVLAAARGRRPSGRAPQVDGEPPESGRRRPPLRPPLRPITLGPPFRRT